MNPNTNFSNSPVEPIRPMSEIALLHEPFARYLREKGCEFIRARSDRESTIETGWPDFSLQHPAFPSIFIEFKWGKGALTAAQKRVRARLIGRGHVVHVCRDIDSAVRIVEAWFGGILFKSPVAVDSAPAREELRQHGGNVWHSPTGKNDWRFLRKATAADIHLPKLLP